MLLGVNQIPFQNVPGWTSCMKLRLNGEHIWAMSNYYPIKVPIKSTVPSILEADVRDTIPSQFKYRYGIFLAQAPPPSSGQPMQFNFC